MSNEQETNEAANAISAMHNKLTSLEQSRVDHYNRCHARGRVPVNHHSGGWYNSYAGIQLILLYLRLPEVLRAYCTTPSGLGAYKRMIKRRNKQDQRIMDKKVNLSRGNKNVRTH